MDAKLAKIIRSAVSTTEALESGDLDEAREIESGHNGSAIELEYLRTTLSIFLFLIHS